MKLYNYDEKDLANGNTNSKVRTSIISKPLFLSLNKYYTRETETKTMATESFVYLALTCLE